MPRSVVVVSSDPDLFQSVRTVLRTDERFIDASDEIHCDSHGAPLTNIYPAQLNADEWDGWDPSKTEMPDPRSMSYLILECRSPEWVAEVGRLLAQGLRRPLWVVDADDTAWPANRIDPTQIALT